MAKKIAVQAVQLDGSVITESFEVEKYGTDPTGGLGLVNSDGDIFRLYAHGTLAHGGFAAGDHRGGVMTEGLRLCAWCTDPKIEDTRFLLGQRFCSDACRDAFIVGMAEERRTATPKAFAQLVGPCTVWVDYGTEGWRPQEFKGPEEARDFILNGPSCPVRVTQDAVLILLSRGDQA